MPVDVAQERRGGAHRADGDDGADAQAEGQAIATRLQGAFAFHDQPGRAQQRIAADQAHADQHGKGLQPVEPAAGIDAVLDGDALQQGAQGDTLREGRGHRADAEGDIPVGAMAGSRSGTRRRRRGRSAPAAWRRWAHRAPTGSCRRPAERRPIARRRPAPARSRCRPRPGRWCSSRCRARGPSGSTRRECRCRDRSRPSRHKRRSRRR